MVIEQNRERKLDQSGANTSTPTFQTTTCQLVDLSKSSTGFSGILPLKIFTVDLSIELKIQSERSFTWANGESDVHAVKFADKICTA